LCYSFDPVFKVLDPERVMGIDLGIRNAAYMAFSFDKYLREIISGDDIIKHKTRVLKALSESKKKRKYCVAII
jgi:transposase